MTRASDVKVRRSFDAGDINPVLNHPEVFPAITVPGLESFDVTDLVADRRNHLVMAERGGGLLFVRIEPGIYEFHTNFLPEVRGRYAIAAIRAAFHHMFIASDAMVLLTKVPEFNKGARRCCQLVGMTLEFERSGVWPVADGFVDMSYWALRYDDWVRTAPGLVESGQAFHHRLEEEYVRLGRDLGIHPEDVAHDRHVGAVVEMVYAGQQEKGVVLYNRFAQFAGYAPVALVSASPLLLDIVEAVLQFSDGTFRVIKVR